MKIDVVSSVQQTKTELDEKFFSIADPAFIFDLLRNKIYSNPITAVCREVACNALDAQREVGKENIPVTISLPTYEDPYFKVKDCGPGISPDRMDNIFLKYAASTKRDSNDQIGGFGIGAKSPFSYSDSFSIVTNVDGKCYNYAAFIDESRIGKLILLNETDTVEANGTEIIVPVKSQDYNNFYGAVESCTRHWKVKPTFLGRSMNYRSINPVIGNDSWFVAHSDGSSYYSRNIKTVVGEIEYNLDVNAIREFANLDFLKAIHGDLFLKFNVGDVSLAANRESVYLDPKTKEVIKERLSLVKSEYTQLIKDKVNSHNSLIEANIFYANDLAAICGDLSVVGQLSWNGIPVKSEIRNSDDITAIGFTRKTKYGSEKISRTYCNGIRFHRLSKIIIHDCGAVEPSTRHVKKFFDENRDINTLYVVSPGENVTLDDMMATYHLDQMDLESLSKHNSNIKSRKQSASIAKVMVFKLEGDQFGLSSAAAVRSETKSKVLVYLEKDSWNHSKKNALRADKITRVSSALLSSISKMDNEIAIYGVDKDTPESRVKDIFGSFKSVDAYLDELASKYDRDYLVETVWANSYYTSSFDWMIGALSSNVDMLTKKDGLATKLISVRDELSKIVTSRRDYMTTISKLELNNVSSEEVEKFAQENNKESLSNIWQSFLATYPMLSLVDRYDMSTETTIKLINYINLVDKQ